VSPSFYKLNWPVMMAFSLVLFYFLYNDKLLSTVEGLILFLGLNVFLFFLIRSARGKVQMNDEVDETLSIVSNFRITIWLLIGAGALYFGSEWLVSGAVDLAKAIGVSEAVISVSMIAIGTSVPELAASVIAAAKQEKAISLGNLIGSNIFNIGSVLGLTSIIKVIPVTDPSILNRDIFWMLFFSAVLIPMILIPKRFTINRFKGFFLVICYGIFIVIIFNT